MPAKKDPHSNPTRNALILFSILLFSGRAYSLKRLAEILHCSRQSVLRLIEQIEVCGYGDIRKNKKDGQNYYQIVTAEIKPQVTLSPQEIERLVCCREWLRHLLPQGIYCQMEHSVEKSATLLEDYKDRITALEPVASSTVQGSINYTTYEERLEGIIKAIRTKQVLEIVYQSPKKSEPRTHEIIPVRLLAFHQGLYIRAIQ